MFCAFSLSSTFRGASPTRSKGFVEELLDAFHVEVREEVEILGVLCCSP